LGYGLARRTRKLATTTISGIPFAYDKALCSLPEGQETRLIDYYRRSLADVPAGLSSGEWELLYRYNAGRLRQDLLEVTFGPEPFKGAALAGLWFLGCSLSLVLAVACICLAIHAVLSWSDQRQLAAASRVAAKLGR
jgi:hypothetical protein